ncbi:MAG: hypothetical protein R2788_01940 [Saprospiraceae bacterium]
MTPTALVQWWTICVSGSFPPLLPVNIPDVPQLMPTVRLSPANIGDGSSTDNCSATETSPAINYSCADTTQMVADRFRRHQCSTINCSFNVVDNVLPCGKIASPKPSRPPSTPMPSTIDPNFKSNETAPTSHPSLSASPWLFDCQHEGIEHHHLDRHRQRNTASCTPPSKWPNLSQSEFDGYRPPKCAGWRWTVS